MKKAQAAMEFLMTYGWAILVVLAAIAALAYFGVFNMGNILPDKCTMEAGFSCTDFKLSEGTDVTVYLINNLGYDINTVTVGVEECGTTTSVNSGNNWKNGEAQTITVTTCTNDPFGAGDADTAWESDLNVSYTNAQSGVTHVANGLMQGTIEP